ncbi:sensor histidine kinase [Thalassobacillus devorans]|uniref:Sensor histidine kinase n=1 Tax=Thalassobacillus devorans TaxID=279813 RepID=A0ABQ1PGL7_9BACI|nr:sensor histidine kinase [Thalassobacillus devorans]NIK29477.1 NarL family two-component system sensor histidine kinase LiaS [Thalassobacillus devorans]GGC96977.1 sensor histidine kinase [Thalassobacillus devorans]
MNMVMRQILSAVLFSILITIIIAGTTFLAFPLKEWEGLWEVEVFDFPYLMVIVSAPLIIGMIIGVVYGWFWRRKLHGIDRQLNELVKGQKRSKFENETIQEITDIEKHISQLEEKINKQVELSQRLATERTNEREKSLQEVVIQERNRLARELHDSVSQQLFAASMMMSAINEGDNPGNIAIKKQLAMVEKMIHQSQLEMRALLLHLRPVALKGKSIREGVEELLAELTQKVPMTIEWNIEDIKMDKGVEDQLFRILQESISNTLRHAKADKLHVLLIERDELIIMRVVDDGAGFDVEQAKSSSYGLQNMQERAYEVGGTFKIVSIEGQGTRLEVKVPALKEGEGND